MKLIFNPLKFNKMKKTKVRYQIFVDVDKDGVAQVTVPDHKAYKAIEKILVDRMKKRYPDSDGYLFNHDRRTLTVCFPWEA